MFKRKERERVGEKLEGPQARAIAGTASPAASEKLAVAPRVGAAAQRTGPHGSAGTAGMALLVERFEKVQSL